MAQDNVDLLIKNIKVYNTYFKKFHIANVAITNGKIYYIDEHMLNHFEAREIIDGKGHFMVPGLIDIHMHIESSMMTPAAFCNHLVKCGVTTIVSEPHEIANVNGIEGILDMVKAGEQCPIDIFYGIPSCVPSSSVELETTGGVIGQNEMTILKDHPSVVCIGEVMNYRQIVSNDSIEILEFIRKLRKKDKIFPIEGHCPSLKGLELAKFIYNGIDSDHTEHTIEELRQRFANGMFMEIQEKMMNKDVMELIHKNNLYEHFCFVTDDVMADVFYTYGHLDALVRKAMSMGVTPENAIYNATYTAARRMNMFDRGALTPGKLADFIIVDDLDNFTISSTYKGGKCVFNKNIPQKDNVISNKVFEKYYSSIYLNKINEKTLRIPFENNNEKVIVRVMEIKDLSTRTTERLIEMPVENGEIKWQDSGCLLAAVFERYGKNGNVGFGFVQGDCLKVGAVATSYAHDCHNVLVVGSNVTDMVAAANRLIDLQGGIVVTNDKDVQAELKLNIGGILSGSNVSEISKDLNLVRQALINQGYRHYNPIMSLCTITLPASPSLKLTDKGLINVENSSIVPLIVT